VALRLCTESKATLETAPRVAFGRSLRSAGNMVTDSPSQPGTMPAIFAAEAISSYSRLR
jgi:hypothetical protein